MSRILHDLAHGRDVDLTGLTVESFDTYAQGWLFCVLAAFADCDMTPDASSVRRVLRWLEDDGILLFDGADEDGEPLGRDELGDIMREWWTARCG